jgi:phage shock protein A
MGLISRIVMLFKSKTSAALDRAEDPRELVDYAYSQQQELLRKTKQGLIEVATSKARLVQQSKKLRAQVPRIKDQAGRALKIGREDLARIALQRKQTVLAEVEQLDVQAAEIGEEERRLTQTEQDLAVRVEQFRVRRDSISARYSAAQAQVRVTEALSGVSGEFAELGMAMGRAMEKTDRMQARASAIGALFESGSLALPEHGSSDPVERELGKVIVDQTVEDELAALKARLDPGAQPPALGSGPDDEEKRPKSDEE